MLDLAAELPNLLPTAVAWVQQQETQILATGRTLSPIDEALAKAVGVRDFATVRIKIVSQLPQPTDPRLAQAAKQTGLLGLNMAAITFGHGIYIRQGAISNRLVSHELRHVYQYEQAGSIAAFLATYLHQIVTVGYDRAPLEIDARAHEREA
jgi:uncharacterized protein DUF4157